MRHCVVVHNQRAGAADQLTALREAFATHGAEPEYIPLTDSKLRQTIKKAAKKEGAIIVAAGGDGTVSAVAGYVQGTTAKLGVIPIGTLNHFAKDAGLELDMHKAVQTVLSGALKRVDTGEVNKRVFINNASIGWYPGSLKTRQKLRPKIGNLPAAIVAAVAALAHPRRYRVELIVDGKRLVRRTPFVLVGNNRYGAGGGGFSERSSLTEGTLAIYVIKARSAWGVVRLISAALFTRKRRTPDFDIFYASQCVIRSHHKYLRVAADGEVARLATPLTFTVRPKNLTVIVPHRAN